VYGLDGLRDRIQKRCQDALEALKPLGSAADDLRKLTDEMATRRH